MPILVLFGMKVVLFNYQVKDSMPYFAVPNSNGVNIHYQIFENVVPTTTFFIHGNLASNNWWMPLLNLIKAEASSSKIENKGHVIMAEFRGCGGSTAPATVAGMDMNLLAEDFLALLRSLKQDLGLGKVNVVGHSTGGLIGALMMGQQTDLFGRGILLDPVGATGVKFDQSMLGAFEAMKSDRALVAVVIGSTIQGNNPEDSYFREVIVEDAVKSINTVGAWVLQALDGFDGRETIKNIKNPVLVLHGSNDSLLSSEESKALAQLIPNGKFQFVEGQGHCTNVENPQKLLQIMNGFFNS